MLLRVGSGLSVGVVPERVNAVVQFQVGPRGVLCGGGQLGMLSAASH